MWLLPSNGLVYDVVDFISGDDADGCMVDPGCGYYSQINLRKKKSLKWFGQSRG